MSAAVAVARAAQLKGLSDVLLDDFADHVRAAMRGPAYPDIKPI